MDEDDAKRIKSALQNIVNAILAARQERRVVEYGSLPEFIAAVRAAQEADPIEVLTCSWEGAHAQVVYATWEAREMAREFTPVQLES